MTITPSKRIEAVIFHERRLNSTGKHQGNVYLKLRDQLGTIFNDADFAALFPKDGQPS